MSKPHRYEQTVQRSRLLPKLMLNSKFTAPGLCLPLAQGLQRPDCCKINFVQIARFLIVFERR